MAEKTKAQKEKLAKNRKARARREQRSTARNVAPLSAGRELDPDAK